MGVIASAYGESKCELSWCNKACWKSSGKDKLSEFMSDDEKEELEMKAYNVIQLCLADKVL